MTARICGSLLVRIAEENLQQLLDERSHSRWQIDDLQRRNTKLVVEKRELMAKLAKTEEQLRIARDK